MNGTAIRSGIARAGSAACLVYVFSSVLSITAQNIANADTPRYEARDVRPFSFASALLRTGQAGAPLPMAATNGRHIGAPSSTGATVVDEASAYADDQAHAQRIYDYISRLWFMPATPLPPPSTPTRTLAPPTEDASRWPSVAGNAQLQRTTSNTPGCAANNAATPATASHNNT